MRNAMVVILSPEAARSRWVRYEIDQAINRYNGPERFVIVPIIYRACALPRLLAIFQALDFTQADDDPAAYGGPARGAGSAHPRGPRGAQRSLPAPFDLGLLARAAASDWPRRRA